MEKHNNERLKLRNFGISFSIGMTLLFTIGIIKKFSLPFLIIIGITGIFHIFSVFKPEFLKFTNYITSKLFFLIGSIITNLFLILFFYLVFTPFAIILRISGKDEIKNNSKFPHWIDIKQEENNPERIKKLY
ncbi:MAG: hypothetical protein ACP5QT_06470 [Brevinematia bacterium]